MRCLSANLAAARHRRTEIFLHAVELRNRHIKPVRAFVFEQQIIVDRARHFAPRHAAIARDAVIDMHHDNRLRANRPGRSAPRALPFLAVTSRFFFDLRLAAKRTGSVRQPNISESVRTASGWRLWAVAGLLKSPKVKPRLKRWPMIKTRPLCNSLTASNKCT